MTLILYSVMNFRVISRPRGTTEPATLILYFAALIANEHK